jgi:threonine/homoserine/homoserine lactone efflux protein
MELLSENIWVFFGSAILISFTGVMTPGPLFAAAVAKGYKDKRAGIKIALGHGLVEFPLIALIFFSIGTIFTDPLVKLGIGLVGGAFLLQMGYKMVKSRRMIAAGDEQYFPYDSLWAGAITSSINPYFLLWWATAGAVLIFNAEFFGAFIVVVFAIVHWSCDLAWYTFTSFTVFKTKHLWTPRVHDIVFGVCGVIMVAFGAYFIAGTGYELAKSL